MQMNGIDVSNLIRDRLPRNPLSIERREGLLEAQRVIRKEQV